MWADPSHGGNWDESRVFPRKQRPHFAQLTLSGGGRVPANASVQYLYAVLQHPDRAALWTHILSAVSFVLPDRSIDFLAVYIRSLLFFLLFLYSVHCPKSSP